ncbi:GNAT family N-acetyltransferase [Streptomyces winkii]|uniref:GNAT family N-acetyltransferase n=1 Tax=Streptomyces winkii TaxID=3051178 RepID=UPI0028D45AF0|nr:GNAT family N-acetyltransferase [Streptomyces sp. DSM 40971]
MDGTPSWPAAAPITTARLRLEPLRAEHAPEAFELLDDVRLHTWTGGSPRTPEQLDALYRRQSAGRSPDGTQGWLNWMLRRLADGRLVGTVQATLDRTAGGGTAEAGPTARLTAQLAWVVGTEHQGRGYAREGASAMARWLRGQGVDAFTAHIHPEHRASAAVARAVGLAPTDTVVEGEIRWSSTGD